MIPSAAAISGRKRGRCAPPFSALSIVDCVVPAAAASCCWLQPFASRASLICLPIPDSIAKLYPSPGKYRDPIACNPIKGYYPMMREKAKHSDIEAAIKTVGSQAALARRCNCAQQQISKLLNRELPVSAEMAKAIDEATDGEVPRWRLRPDLWSPPKTARAVA